VKQAGFRHYAFNIPGADDPDTNELEVLVSHLTRPAVRIPTFPRKDQSMLDWQ
jgi:hypothetical protein